MRAETLTRALGGRWHGSYGAACCPAHEDRNPSLSIKDGRDGRLLLHCFAGCDFNRICDAITARSGANYLADLPYTAHDCRKEHRQRTASGIVERIWSETAAIGGTLAERYLRARGIVGALPATLRFHARLRHAHGDVLPAMIARVDAVDGRPLGLHRTFLDPVSPRKSVCTPAKMMLGPCQGGAVRLRSGQHRLAVAEGIETALSVAMGVDNDVSVWATLSTSGMIGLRLPNPVHFDGSLLVATDGDKPGRTAGATLAERAASQGWCVEVVSAPDGLDFNDLIAGAALG